MPKAAPSVAQRSGYADLRTTEGFAKFKKNFAKLIFFKLRKAFGTLGAILQQPIKHHDKNQINSFNISRWTIPADKLQK